MHRSRLFYSHIKEPLLNVYVNEWTSYETSSLKLKRNHQTTFVTIHIFWVSAITIILSSVVQPDLFCINYTSLLSLPFPLSFSSFFVCSFWCFNFSLQNTCTSTPFNPSSGNVFFKLVLPVLATRNLVILCLFSWVPFPGSFSSPKYFAGSSIAQFALFFCRCTWISLNWNMYHKSYLDLRRL